MTYEWQCLDKREEEVSRKFGVDGGRRSVTGRGSSADVYKSHRAPDGQEVAASGQPGLGKTEHTHHWGSSYRPAHLRPGGNVRDISGPLTRLLLLVSITSSMLSSWAWGFTRDPYLVHLISKWKDTGMLQLCVSCQSQTHCWIKAVDWSLKKECMFLTKDTAIYEFLSTSFCVDTMNIKLVQKNYALMFF